MLGSALVAAEGRSQATADPRLDTQSRAVQALSSSELVEVRLLKKGAVSGSIVSSTEMGLTIAANGGQVMNLATDIRELKVKRRQRLRK
jgi:hypothetical protein